MEHVRNHYVGEVRPAIASRLEVVIAIRMDNSTRTILNLEAVLARCNAFSFQPRFKEVHCVTHRFGHDYVEDIRGKLAGRSDLWTVCKMQSCC